MLAFKLDSLIDNFNFIKTNFSKKVILKESNLYLVHYKKWFWIKLDGLTTKVT